MAGDWMKGGLRYKALKRKVPALLEPERVEAFFIAVRGRGPGMSPIDNLSKRQFVIAATEANVYVLRLAGLGTFASKIAGIEAKFPLGDAPIQWSGETLRIGEVEYGPIEYHAEDAERVYRRVTSAQ